MVISEKQENVSLDTVNVMAERVGMNSGTPIADRIRVKLTDAFAPVALDVVDESAKHAGHSGARPEGETHFRVRIVSSAFAGISRVERQRKVYAALSEEMMNRVHALSVAALTPEEQ